MGFLKRALRTAPLEIKDYLYKQLLLPSIEYCSAIWDPHHITSIYKLEMIQHWAARFILNKPLLRSAQQENSSVTDMLTYLKWSTLQDRRTIARLTLLFKILHKMIAIPDRCLPSPAPISFTRSNNPLKVTHLQTRNDAYKYSFLPRMIIQRNQLQISVNNIGIDTFKNTLINIICNCNQ